MQAHIYDPIACRIIDGEIETRDGHIVAIHPSNKPLPSTAPCILPGFVDAHVHIESSMLLPVNFARAAVCHGVVAAVCDPHEIANVLGVEGVRFMVENGKQSPFHFYFGVPSCVPSTGFETAGAALHTDEVRTLLAEDDIHFLSEVMSVPDVLMETPDMMGKLQAARYFGKPIDGHATGLTSDEIQRYASAGITTNHECITLDEARGNIQCGIDVLIREGSAARNLDTLMPLVEEAPEHVMLCTDDSHPDTLEVDYIDSMVRRILDAGHSIWNVLHAASVNPVRHYHMDIGLLQPGDWADYIVVDNLQQMHIIETHLHGTCYDRLHPLPITDTAQLLRQSLPNNFHALPIEEEQLQVHSNGGNIRCIVAHDKSLLTESISVEPLVVDGNILPDTERDILKIVVYNRYEKEASPAIGFIHGFGIRDGAFASTIAHDSHNIIAIGSSDALLVEAINAIVEMQGGLVVCESNRPTHRLPLPIAGLLSIQPLEQVAAESATLTRMVQSMGCPFQAPFLTMGFMALPVLPSLKMTDKGLFDYATFAHTSLEHTTV